jgi:hypothetical protein
MVAKHTKAINKRIKYKVSKVYKMKSEALLKSISKSNYNPVSIEKNVNFGANF